MFAAVESKKRSRVDDDEEDVRSEDAHLEKRSRPTAETRAGEKWYHGHHDSVLSTPSSQAREQPKYDSDDEQSSSMVSEPGSPQDISMDEDMDCAAFSQSPEDTMMQPQAIRQSPFGQRLQTIRVPTPTVAMRPGAPIAQKRSGVRHHIRSRHPQEIFSSDHLEVPSPIDEDEVPTPPSAAEAAGSQLSMLTVSDIDMDEDDPSVPSISIDPARPSNQYTTGHLDNDPDSAVDLEPMDNGPDSIMVRKQRQRSGALSNGDSPVRAGPSNPAAKRGFSVGFRADCEKCRMRVPGHMNHFIV